MASRHRAHTHIRLVHSQQWDRVLYGEGVHANGDSFRLYDLSFLAATQQNSVKQQNMEGAQHKKCSQFHRGWEADAVQAKERRTHTHTTRGNMRRRTIKHKVNRRTVARWTHRDWLLSFACPMPPSTSCSKNKTTTSSSVVAKCFSNSQSLDIARTVILLVFRRTKRPLFVHICCYFIVIS